MTQFRYVAKCPESGPDLRSPSSGQAEWTITGESSPQLRALLMAAFVPVVRDRRADKLGAADREGNRKTVTEVGWVTPCNEGRFQGRFEVKIPRQLWEGNIDGVLIVLIYDEALPPEPAFGQRRSAPQGEFARERPKDLPRKAMPISQLPDTMTPEAVVQLRDQLDGLLRSQSASALNFAVIRRPA